MGINSTNANKKKREKMRGGRERDIVPLAPFRLISLGRKQWGVRDGGSFQRQVKSILRIESPLDQDLVAPCFLSQGSQGKRRQTSVAEEKLASF